MADDPELEGIKVRADAMRRLGITDPHVVDYEYRLWMVERLRKVAVELSGGLIKPNQAGSMAQTVSLCTGMMLAMASMLAEEGKRKMAEAKEADAQKSEEVEKETRAGKGGDGRVLFGGELRAKSASGAAVMFVESRTGSIVWLPLSQVVFMGVVKEHLARHGELPELPVENVSLSLPRWLAEKKGLLG